MFLSRIELVGFKSFANRTVFYFNGGVTAIVGPNGCGKTNVVDSIRWVLGEQKTSLLRSEVMENVIFNGSANRKPLGMAEVSITFINDKNILPTQFNEVTITRRLYRDGQSEYLINNSQCRLKDIVDLFLDTGIGHNSYSIIELRMIENLLNGSVEERRRLLEEAAGVAKFKQRKKETTKRLESVQNDLQRIYDIVGEIEHQVRSLARQASKTRRYNQIQSQLKELELTLWGYNFINSNKILNNIESQNITKKEEKEKLILLLEDVNKEINEFESKLSKLEEELQEVYEEENKAFRDFSDFKNRINLISERIVSIDANIKKLNEESKDALNIISRYVRTLKELENLKLSKRNILDNLLKNYENFKGEIEQLDLELKERQENFNSIREDIIKVQNELKYEKLNQNKLLSSIENLWKQKQKIEKDQEQILSDLNRLSSEKVEIMNEINNINSQKIFLEKELIEKVHHLEMNKKFLDELRQKENELKIALKEVQVSLDFLNSILDVDENTKYLINDSDWKENRKYSLLSEVIGIDEKFRIAYDSLLGQFKNVLLVDSEQDIEDAIKQLSKGHKGKCLFVSMDKVPEDLVFDANFDDSKIIGFVWQLPEIDNKIRNIFYAIFGNSVIVRNYEDAVEISQKYPVQCVVTLSGELVWGKYIQKRGQILKMEGLSIGKEERINKLLKKRESIRRELKEVETEFHKLLAENKSLEASIYEIKSKISKLDEKIKNLGNSHQKLENQLSNLNYRKDSAEDELRIIDLEIQKFNSEIEVLNLKIEQLSKNLEEFNSNNRASESDFTEFQRFVEERKVNFNESEKQIVRIKTELEGIEKEILRIKSGKETQEKKIEKINNEIEILVQNKLELEKELNEIRKQKVEEDLVKIRNRRGFLIEKKKEYDDIINQQKSHRNEIQYKIDKVSSLIYQNEIEIARLKENLHSLFSKALEVYNVNLNDINIEFGKDLNLIAIEEEIGNLKKSLASFGNVNFLALQEYEEQKQRLDLYKKQIDDLTRSESSLKEALKEINQKAVEKFLVTFEKINSNFSKVFAELFGGDSFAELVIDRSNPLESDVEIRVKPAGKRVNSIDTLSQGEKTLTVLSLLFALYLVKPSPFCVLDEVDAPLDDANVDRFLNLLRKFSSEVQFVLITHNKRTMEFADVLYGITMAEDGVSKVLSVKLVE